MPAVLHPTTLCSPARSCPAGCAGDINPETVLRCERKQERLGVPAGGRPLPVSPPPLPSPLPGRSLILSRQTLSVHSACPHRTAGESPGYGQERKSHDTNLNITTWAGAFGKLRGQKVLETGQVWLCASYFIPLAP